MANGFGDFPDNQDHFEAAWGPTSMQAFGGLMQIPDTQQDEGDFFAEYQPDLIDPKILSPGESPAHVIAQGASQQHNVQAGMIPPVEDNHRYTSPAYTMGSEAQSYYEATSSRTSQPPSLALNLGPQPEVHDLGGRTDTVRTFAQLDQFSDAVSREVSNASIPILPPSDGYMSPVAQKALAPRLQHTPVVSGADLNFFAKLDFELEANRQALRYSSFRESEFARRPIKLRWDPSTVHDLTFPTTPQQEQIYVQIILQSILMNGFEQDNPQKVLDFSKIVNTAPAKVESGAWSILKGLMDYHQRGGPSSLPANAKAQNTPSYKSEFYKHVQDVCEILLTRYKSCCIAIVDGGSIERIVDNPEDRAVRSTRNLKGNKRRGEQHKQLVEKEKARQKASKGTETAETKPAAPKQSTRAKRPATEMDELDEEEVGTTGSASTETIRSPKRARLDELQDSVSKTSVQPPGPVTLSQNQNLTPIRQTNQAHAISAPQVGQMEPPPAPYQQAQASQARQYPAQHSASNYNSSLGLNSGGNYPQYPTLAPHQQERPPLHPVYNPYAARFNYQQQQISAASQPVSQKPPPQGRFAPAKNVAQGTPQAARPPPAAARSSYPVTQQVRPQVSRQRPHQYQGESYDLAQLGDQVQRQMAQGQQSGLSPYRSQQPPQR